MPANRPKTITSRSSWNWRSISGRNARRIITSSSKDSRNWVKSLKFLRQAALLWTNRRADSFISSCRCPCRLHPLPDRLRRPSPGQRSHPPHRKRATAFQSPGSNPKRNRPKRRCDWTMTAISKSAGRKRRRRKWKIWSRNPLPAPPNHPTTV